MSVGHESVPVRELALDLAGMARARGHAQRAQLLEQLAAAADSGAPAAATVVVAGEAKCGKSSLVNALLGPVEISPVDPGIATSCHVVLRGGDEPSARVHLRDGTSESISFDEIWRFATQDGDRSEETSSMELVLDNELLRRGIVLVDTPGVGGLVAGHAEITRAALVGCDALIFVLDAESEISGPEIAFLEQVTERIGVVLFAFTKIDDYAAWRTLLDKTRARLPARFADSPIIPLSSVTRQRAYAAAARDSDDEAARLRSKSGFDELQEQLDLQVIQRAADLPTLRLLAACDAALAELRAVDLAATNPSGADIAEQSRTAQQELTEFQQATARLSHEVVQDLEQLRMAIASEFDRRKVELERAYATHIAEWRDGLEGLLPSMVQSDLDALAGSLNAMFLEGLSDIDATLTERFMLEAMDLPELPRTTAQLPDAVPARDAPGTEASRMRRTQMLLMGGGAGARLGWLGGEAALGLFATASIGMLPVGIAVVGGAAGFALARRVTQSTDRGLDRARAQAQADRLIRDALAEATVSMRNPLNDQIVALRRDVQAQVERRIEERRSMLEAERQRLTLLAGAQKAEQLRIEKAAKARLAELAPLQLRLDGLLDDVRSAGGAQ